jgi:hypothetical protein
MPAHTRGVHRSRSAAQRRSSESRLSPPSVQQVIRSPGQSLPEDVRAEAQARFGNDFLGVRVHTDPVAAASAAVQQAEAYTVGSHIAFAPGRFAPHTDAGRQLLVHELTHVVQQRGASTPSGALAVSKPSDPAEQQAAQSARGDQVDRYLATPATVHRAFGRPVQHSGLHGADAVIPLDKFIGYVEEVERANPKDTAAEIVSRMRVQYYGGEGSVDFAKFDQLIPDAQAYDSYTTFGFSPDVVQPSRSRQHLHGCSRTPARARRRERGR